MLQALIDHPNLQPFLHPKVPGRVPLAIYVPSVKSVLHLQKFGRNVTVLSSLRSDTPYLNVTTWHSEGSKTTLRFEYLVEGVVGIARYTEHKLQEVDLVEQSSSSPSTRIKHALGSANLALFKNPSKAVHIAKLKVAGANRERKSWLTQDSEIAGFKIATPLKDVSNNDWSKILLDDRHYDFNRRVRCKNDYYIGLRWQHREQRVEFALGIKCRQAFFIYPTPSGIGEVAGILNAEVSTKLIAELSSNE